MYKTGRKRECVCIKRPGEKVFMYERGRERECVCMTEGGRESVYV